MTSFWQPIIGLEVHAELQTESKMFCPCANRHFQEKPNSYVCPICLGMPGALPSANRQAIEDTILIGLAFSCRINRHFWFDRKNYFYPDLPKGYQISQHFRPIAEGGCVPIWTEKGLKNIDLDNIHLEEDTGKLIHRERETLIDYNRSGVPLVEIVTKPVIHSGEEAKLYLQRLQQTLRWLGVSDCDMEKGTMRLEVNISIANSEQVKKGILPAYKVEIKNLNSFRFVNLAIDYETKRQTQILKQGLMPKQETRGYDAEEGKTYSQRSKEVAKDYRYFPEPDLPPFLFSPQQIKAISKRLVELPWEKEGKLLESGLDLNTVRTITKSKGLSELLTKCSRQAKGKIKIPEIAKYLVNQKQIRKLRPSLVIAKIEAEKSKYNLQEKLIIKMVRQTITEQEKAVADFRAGKNQVVGFLVGQVQELAKGKADPKITATIILRELEKGA